MKTKLQKISLAALIAASMTTAGMGQPFDAGSTGADGPLNVTSNTTLTLPANGIFNFTTISVAAGTTLTFARNPLNTAVHMLATSNVTIAGTIDVSGLAGSATGGGRGGPGGFDGGYPGLDANTPPGSGLGPGGGPGGQVCCAANSAGAGGYGTVGGYSVTTNKGAAYGSPLLMPLAGGSGGGGIAGTPGVGGGGGGGAILIGSNTRIDLISPGTVKANGGPCTSLNDGSGGAIRLIAPVVTGNGTLSADGPCYGGSGRIRIDTTNRRAVTFTSNPTASIGANMSVFPNPIPRLDIINAAGTAIPEGNSGAVSVQLPFGSTTNRTVTVQARGFNASVPIAVALTPDTGLRTVYQ
ncbi:MAG TPA: hypothetical protein VMZ27_12435, partial [Candidatus Saccharimonadales bacterium]|nr:hypothetical protein [Candidatus Saccharimonadales bacterium]